MSEVRGAHRIGTTIRAKYHVDALIGTGGMAVVYAVTHRNNKRFAMKMLFPELSVTDSIKKRFLREGYVANTVSHPGAVAVVDDDIAEDGSAYLVMELLEGVSVDEAWERAAKHLPMDVTLEVARQALDVLAAAHPKGIVHRDLKPANLFLTKEGRVKILDFGIARLHQNDAGGIATTQSGVAMGTPAFMPPEQALGKTTEIDARTDLWAIGATIFTLLSGHFVHAADNSPQMLVAAATRAARPLSALLPHIPPSLEAFVAKALAIERADRFQSAEEMRDAVDAVVHELAGSTSSPVQALVMAAEAGPRKKPVIDVFARTAAPMVTTAKPVSSNPEKNVSRRRISRPLLAIGAACLVAGAVGISIRLRTHPAPVSTPGDAVATTPQSPPTAAPPILSDPSPVASQSAAPSAMTAPPMATTAVTHRTQPSIKPATTAAASASAAPPKPNCDPAYTVDENGKRHYKTECL